MKYILRMLKKKTKEGYILALPWTLYKLESSRVVTNFSFLLLIFVADLTSNMIKGLRCYFQNCMDYNIFIFVKDIATKL
jgi:hypothetical protein